MAEKLTLIEIDGSTGIETIRELTAEEIAERKQLELEAEELAATIQAKADARVSALAKLAALGLTEEEIAAL
jgi:hypothetical protein